MKSFWKFANRPLPATIIGGVVVVALTAWRWEDAKALARSTYGTLKADFSTASTWFQAPAQLSHLNVGLLLALLVVLSAVAVWLALMLRKGRREEQRVAEEALKVPSVSVKFDPDGFTLTPPRCRALLVLADRIDARTTLHELHTLVTTRGYDIDRSLSKAQLQLAMDEAEQAGLVRIDRLGTFTQYYNLTVPEGRNWVVRNEDMLKDEAAEQRFELGTRYSS